MDLDQNRLKAACLEIARNTMWERRPVDSAYIVTHAESLYRIAQDHKEFVFGQGRDPNLITRAVRYLGHTHAIPPMREDLHWFFDMLTALIELACPNTSATKEDEMFYRDVEAGIALARLECEGRDRGGHV
jgi:hypothetical protein